VPKESKTTKPTRKPVVRRRRAAKVTHDQIAERAYALYVAGTAGDALEHWVRAERELTAA
jgi:hypothetical protein